MNKLFILSVFCFLGSVSRGADFRITCASPREYASIWSEKDKVYLAVANAEGFQELPVYTGPVTANNFSVVRGGLNDLKELNGNIMVSWEKSKCTQDLKSPMLMKCNGEGTVLMPKTKVAVKSFSLGTSLLNQHSMDFDYDSFNINWGVDREGMHYLVTFNYGKDFCKVK